MLVSFQHPCFKVWLRPLRLFPIEKAVVAMETNDQMGDLHGSTLTTSPPWDLLCRYVNAINASPRNIGKEGKFQLFVCLGVRWAEVTFKIRWYQRTVQICTNMTQVKSLEQLNKSVFNELDAIWTTKNIVTKHMVIQLVVITDCLWFLSAGTDFCPSGSPCWQSVLWPLGRTRMGLCCGTVRLCTPSVGFSKRSTSSASRWRRRWWEGLTSDPDVVLLWNTHESNRSSSWRRRSIQTPAKCDRIFKMNQMKTLATEAPNISALSTELHVFYNCICFRK